MPETLNMIRYVPRVPDTLQLLRQGSTLSTTPSYGPENGVQFMLVIHRLSSYVLSLP